jgi:hypothetical protein
MPIQTGDPLSGVHDTATYIAEIADELSALAARDGLGFLAYLLAMVAKQARCDGEPEEVARRLAVGED